jgi:hypothetical protein
MPKRKTKGRKKHMKPNPNSHRQQLPIFTRSATPPTTAAPVSDGVDQLNSNLRAAIDSVQAAQGRIQELFDRLFGPVLGGATLGPDGGASAAVASTFVLCSDLSHALSKLHNVIDRAGEVSL